MKYSGKHVVEMTPGKLHKFSPVGTCIYCWSVDKPLFTEHIVPFGLGGHHLLPKSSCADCAKVTAQFEQTCLRRMHGSFRIASRMPTRRSKSRPDKIRMKVIKNGIEQEISIRPDEYPYNLMFFIMPPARFLMGLPDVGGSEINCKTWAYMHFDKLDEFVERYDVDGIVSHPVDLLSFTRMIAKIAHAYSIALVGTNGFSPILNDFILGYQSNMNYYVGCWENYSEPITKRFYTIDILENKGVPYFVANVRLFAALGAPTYHVVIGRRPEG